MQDSVTIGAQSLRSLADGVEMFMMDDNALIPTTLQMAHAGTAQLIKPACESTTAMRDDRTHPCTTAATRIGLGNVPCQRPPFARSPQGAPNASAIWNPTAIVIRAVNNRALAVTIYRSNVANTGAWSDGFSQPRTWRTIRLEWADAAMSDVAQT